MLLAERMQNERRRQINKELQRHRFGRRAETLPEDQMLLGLGDVEQAEAMAPSSSTTTPSNAPSAPSRSTAKTYCSQDQMAAPNIGPPSPH